VAGHAACLEAAAAGAGCCCWVRG